MTNSPPRAAPGLGAGRGSQLASWHPIAAGQSRLRPALVLGEDRNKPWRSRSPTSPPRLRPALVLGEDRNPSRSSGSPQPTPGCARPWCWARIATSTPKPPASATTGGCARPWCWARIATGRPATHCRSTGRAAPGLGAGRGSQLQPQHRAGKIIAAELRPALVLGEDRNAWIPHLPPARALQLRPALVLGEDRNSCMAQQVQLLTTGLRPALVLGEDRNFSRSIVPEKSSRPSCARPWCWARIATPGYHISHRRERCSCARPWCWARIATRVWHNRCSFSRQGCARPWCWARIATSVPSVDTETADEAAPGLGAGRGSQPRWCRRAASGERRAAPGLGAGRGSQHGDRGDDPGGQGRCARPWCWARIATCCASTKNPIRSGCARPWCWARIATYDLHGQAKAELGLRPALVLGEDRNTPNSTDHRPMVLALRPALVLGEDRNAIADLEAWVRGRRLRPALVLGEDRNAYAGRDAAPPPKSCARPWCWARIATTDVPLETCLERDGCARPWCWARIATHWGA